MRKVIKPYKILDHRTHVAYTKYVKEGNIPKKHAADGREEMRKILKTICKHIGDGVAESPGGVYVKGLGYFFNWKCPRKMSYHLTKKGEGMEEHFNYHTDHYMYFPTYVPMAGKLHPRATWTMDKQFSKLVTTRVVKNLRAGFKYRNYLFSLKS